MTSTPVQSGAQRARPRQSADEAIRAHAADQPDAPAYIEPGGSLS